MAVRVSEQSDGSLSNRIIWSQYQRCQIVVETAVVVASGTCTCLSIIPLATVIDIVAANVVGDSLAAVPGIFPVLEALLPHVESDLATVVAERLRGTRVVVVFPECAAVVTWVVCRLQEDGRRFRHHDRRLCQVLPHQVG